MCSPAELPAIAAKITISTMCRTNATTWATPTLAAATAAGIFLRCRYLMFSAAPPTAAGVTRVMKEPATWTSRVRKKLSRSATKPDSEIVAPTYVDADRARATIPHCQLASRSVLPRLARASSPASR
jgi:hypothetical protein